MLRVEAKEVLLQDAAVLRGWRGRRPTAGGNSFLENTKIQMLNTNTNTNTNTNSRSYFTINFTNEQISYMTPI